MRKLVGRVLLFAGLATVTSSANAVPLRSPQVAFNIGPLQGFMNILDPGFNVGTSQLNVPAWSVPTTYVTSFLLELRGDPGGGNSVGVYNPTVGAPRLFQVFPPAATPGWSAQIGFGRGNLLVGLFDQNSVFIGQTFFAGVNPSNFGYYAQGQCGTWFSQDSLNQPPAPQALTYVDSDHEDAYWVCFEKCPYDPNSSTFDGVIVSLWQPDFVPAARESWGRVKSMYR